MVFGKYENTGKIKEEIYIDYIHTLIPAVPFWSSFIYLIIYFLINVHYLQQTFFFS